MSNAPFSIGQKVVCIDDHEHEGRNIKILTKGYVYTVKECWGESGLFSPGVRLLETDDLGFFANRFAPIQTNYADATAEILEKFKSPVESPDKVIIPEPVNQ